MPETERSEIADLIRRAQQGDAESRERLFALLRSYLGFAARAQLESWLKVKVDASDLVQQTLLEAHRDFDRFEGGSEGQLLAWLRKILLHNVADFVRHYRGTAKRQVRREVPFANPAASGPLVGAPEPAAPGASPSQEFLRRDNELRLIDALETLYPVQVMQIANGGAGKGAGSVSLLITGQEKYVRAAFDMVQGLSGEQDTSLQGEA